jgi:hypothetical protein
LITGNLLTKQFAVEPLLAPAHDHLNFVGSLEFSIADAVPEAQSWPLGAATELVPFGGVAHAPLTATGVGVGVGTGVGGGVGVGGTRTTGFATIEICCDKVMVP